MRVEPKNLAYHGLDGIAPHHSGWLQAGLKSSAYRLAHLALPRPLTLGLVALLFYIS